MIQKDVLQSEAKAASPFPKTTPNNEAIEKKENPFERSSSDTISAINENELGINAPYPTPIIIAKMKKVKNPPNPGMIIIVNVENIANNNDPITIIHFLINLSAK